MFRIVSEFVEKASFLLICDNPHCGCFLTVEVDPAPTAVQDFCASAGQQGWHVALDQQICPQHVQKARGEHRRIQVVSDLALKN